MAKNKSKPVDGYVVKVDGINDEFTTDYLSVKTHPLNDKRVTQYGLEWDAREDSNHPLIRLNRHLKAYAFYTKKDHSEGNKCYFHFREAFILAWPRFKWHDGFQKEMECWCRGSNMTVIGYTRASKTYGMAHIIFLDWLADPVPRWEKVIEDGVKTQKQVGGTLTTIASTELNRVQVTLGKDIVASINTSQFTDYLNSLISITNNSNGFFITMKDDPSFSKAKNSTRRMYGIGGLGVANASEEKIRGRHCDRRRMIYDEATNIPEAYLKTEKFNISNSPDYKGCHLANPGKRNTLFGMECEPAAEGGWNSVTKDTDVYISKTGRIILHLNAHKNLNFELYYKFREGEITEAEYKRQRVDWMLSYEDSLKYGEQNSPPYYTFVYGWFVDDDAVSKVFSETAIDLMKKDITWDFEPTQAACLDPAYESDDCVIHRFEYGKNRDGEICVKFIETVKVDTNVEDRKTSKDKQLAQRIVELLSKWNVHPNDFIQDYSGNGRSVYSHIQDLWTHEQSMSIHACDFGGTSTERTIYEGDPKKAKEVCRYFVDELWFRAAEWARSGRVFGLNNLHKNTLIDLDAREYYMDGRFQRLYKKKEVKKVLGRSPDFGDAFILFAELLARKGHFPGSKGNLAGRASYMEQFRYDAIKKCLEYEQSNNYTDNYY